MKQIKDRIIAARALIDTPEKWTKNAEARDAAGNPVHRQSCTAKCFCAIAALYNVGLGSASCLFHSLKVPGVIDRHGALVVINDREDTTHADILSLFDKAIALCDAPECNLNPDYYIHEQ